MRYLLMDGAEVEGETATDIVCAMNDAKMTPARDLAVYRNALAGRVLQIYPSAEVDPTTDESLLASLERANLIERL